MKPQVGQYKRFSISIDGGATYVVAMGVINMALPMVRSIVQANNNNNTRSVQKVPTRTDNKATINFHDDPDDPGQAAIRRAQYLGTYCYFKAAPIGVLPDGAPAVGYRLYTFGGFCVSQTPTANDDQPMTLDAVNIEVDGDIIGNEAGDAKVDASTFATHDA